MTGFAEILAGAQPLDDGLSLEIPAAWFQGRTAYGGLTSALALVAAQKVGGAQLPALRSAQFAMIAPVNEPIEVRAKVLRAGRYATWIETRVTSAKGVAMTASFVFMGAVDSALHINERPAPAGTVAPERAKQVPFQADLPSFFFTNFEVRHALENETGGPSGMTCWVRLKDREELDPLVELLLIGDALPPAVFSKMVRRAPLSTMHWQVNMLDFACGTRDGWWLLRTSGDYAEKGCASDELTIWNMQGAPILYGTQSVAVFG